jgi:uncharacterized protein
MHIIRKEKQFTTNWTGGTTTELAIFPAGATYAKRDFDFRISTATVETESSTFTSLPNYKRILMILEGALEICHDGQYTKKLNSNDQDLFDGGWHTTAKGKVTDFNIMFSEDRNAQLTKHSFLKDAFHHFSTDARFRFGYLLSGNVLLNQKQTIHPFDFVVFNSSDNYHLTALTNSEWLSIEIT